MYKVLRKRAGWLGIGFELTRDSGTLDQLLAVLDRLQVDEFSMKLHPGIPNTIVYPRGISNEQFQSDAFGSGWLRPHLKDPIK